MRVIVDWSLCDGNGVCVGIAPEVFEVDDDLNLQVLDETPPESMRPQVEQAVISCPRLAITLQDS
ncbi:MAG: ferredoxin [Thermoleophilaceae bacterium]|jgi:ferredoxin|nr:ferredoxin [Thermoleophilaceae bacterium]MEA2402598.1 ferredoxin [Thermoleophilaceae bacterium]